MRAWYRHPVIREEAIGLRRVRMMSLTLIRIAGNRKVPATKVRGGLHGRTGSRPVPASGLNLLRRTRRFATHPEPMCCSLEAAGRYANVGLMPTDGYFKHHLPFRFIKKLMQIKLIKTIG